MTKDYSKTRFQKAKSSKGYPYSGHGRMLRNRNNRNNPFRFSHDGEEWFLMSANNLPSFVTKWMSPIVVWWLKHKKTWWHRKDYSRDLIVIPFSNSSQLSIGDVLKVNNLVQELNYLGRNTFLITNPKSN